MKIYSTLAKTLHKLIENENKFLPCTYQAAFNNLSRQVFSFQCFNQLPLLILKATKKLIKLIMLCAHFQNKHNVRFRCTNRLYFQYFDNGVFADEAVSYNHGQDICKLFRVLVLLPFTKSEWELDYYH